MKNHLEKINLIYFSATGNTKEIVRAIGHHLEAKGVEEYNLASVDESMYQNTISENSLSIIGVPVYRGRVPLFIAEKLRKLKSYGSLAVIICVYGNRRFDDTLLELHEITVLNGFKIIAAGAFIGEHSYSTEEMPIAHNRPDEMDFAQCYSFAQEIKIKIQNNPKTTTLDKRCLPGNYPYKEHPASPPALSPDTIVDECILCGICADVCPTNAITISKEVATDKEKCIWCCACVKKCPTQARIFKNEVIDGFANMLAKNCQERKEPEWIL